MLSSLFRISKSFFPQVTKGTHFSGGFIKIIVSSPLTNHSSCAVIVSKKYYKRAVQRNYIRRTIYDLFQKQLRYLPKKTYVVMIIKKIPSETNGKKIFFNKKEIKNYLEQDMQHVINLIHKKYE